MDIGIAAPLLAGLTPRAFMRRHWQKKPLVIRATDVLTTPIVTRTQIFELAARDDVECRLVRRQGDDRWTLRHGPLARRALPPLGQRGWTLLVQGVDLHLPAAHELLARFRFLPDARLDDVMVSYASDGGGVGPHVDSYDVFLLQLQGRRRWRVARRHDPALRPGQPLRILARLEPEEDWLLEAGDMLYLPPGWAHDGVAEGECLTASIGFRAAGREEFGRQVLQRALDADDPERRGPLYRDPEQAATDEPARIPPALQAFGIAAVERMLKDRQSLACALGEVLSEPKPGVWFEAPARAIGAVVDASLRLDARSRMLYDDHFVFVNGESYRAAGRDARLMRKLADRRHLAGREAASLSAGAQDLLKQWLGAGWLRPDDEETQR